MILITGKKRMILITGKKDKVSYLNLKPRGSERMILLFVLASPGSKESDINFHAYTP